MNEIWKDVIGYEGVYEVSNLGNVKSLARKGVREDKILKPNADSQGYLKVGLSSSGKLKIVRIHQLVAVAFLNHTPSGNKLVVDHKNNIGTDNRLENLQIITNRENTSKDKKGTSKYAGVYWSKQSKKWRAQITINGKMKHLGLFTDELKASEAYQNKLSNIINN
tara:strand:- start:373 stop:867 length:495 start_codon:yes stop_codon:yes gene_type:complete